MKLFTLTANGDTEVGDTTGAGLHCHAAGTWGSGTLTLKISPDAGTTKLALRDSDGDVAWTTDEMVNFEVPAGYKLYLSLSGSSGADLDVYVGSTDSKLSGIAFA